MASSLPSPQLSKHQQNTQLSYELPHRIYTAKTYPIQSPNGSTIIIYGHEKGVKIIWRGGRSFKIPGESPTTSKKTNGSDDAVIMLDSDDEGPSAAAFVDNPEFEEEEEALDPSRPYPGILQDLDLYFGTDVLHITLLPNSFITAEGGSWRDLEGLKQKIVFVAACADNFVRLVILPLTPPSLTSKARPEFQSSFTSANAGNGKWGETVVLLGGHQKPSDGVAMTADVAGIQKNQTKGQIGSHIIVASHSREMGGLLLLYRISISSPKPHVEPFQTVLLSSPAKTISFNPSSSRSSSCLLVADTSNTCRIYDFKRLVKSSLSEDSSDSPAPEQGTWLISLYPGFQKSKSDAPRPPVGGNSGFGRKTIVDAQWVAGGKAIMVLLNDGEWAIWDIEGVGPSAKNGLLGGQGVKGGSRTEYSLSGFIEGNKPRPAGPPQITGSKFVPMTPGTRKATEPFSKSPSGPIRGQISITQIPSTSPSSPSEESIVFWLGDSFTAIHSLSKYWAANARKSSNGGNLFNGTPGGRMTKLENIDLQGERCSGIEQLITSPGRPSEILILGEHRLAFLSTGKPPSPFQPSNRMALVEKSTNSGELDVVGIDQALARMESSNDFLSKSRVFK